MMAKRTPLVQKMLDKIKQTGDYYEDISGNRPDDDPKWQYNVGDIVVPADGSNYRCKIIYISQEDDCVRYECLTTGKIYEKSFFGFFCRYTLERV